MRLEKLCLRNFRGVAKLDLDFAHQTTVLVGVNGVGKSAILDALAIAFSQLAWRINDYPQKSRPIASGDLKIGERHASIVLDIQFHGHPLSWRLAHNKGGQPRGRPDLASKLDALNEAIKTLHQHWSHVEEDRQEPFDLPLAVYYDVHRAVVETPMRVREQLQHNPFEAYRDALDHGGADFKRFFIWFRNREDWENEQRRDEPNFRDRYLKAVRTATETFTGFTNIRIRRNPLRMTVEKDGLELAVEQLSDGEKCLLALVGDLARRLALLNPGRKNPLDGDGIVLIDEIDLHLHPRWQRNILPRLEKTFPNCQFVVSTHSPQILSHVQADQVWLLRQEKDGLSAFHPQVTFGLDSSRLLEEVMEVSQREPSIEDGLTQLFRMIEENNFAGARNLLVSLKDQAPEIPEYGRAEALMKRKELIGR
jgi:predicted ATP-binding protein involved in virulence